MSSDDEARLMRTIAESRDGLNAAFEEFEAEFRPLIWKQAFGMISARDAADDVTQEVMILVLRSAHQFDPVQGSLRAWAAGITKNAALRCINKKRRQQSVDAGALPVSEERSRRRAEMCQTVSTRLSCLTNTERTVVVLKLLGLSDAEIATALDIKESSVPTLVSRAKKNVQEANRISQKGCEGHHA